MLNLNFKNLGPILQGDISLSPFTIICGKNNVGKTYVSHAIYACLVELKKTLSAIDFSKVDAAIKTDKGLGSTGLFTSTFDVRDYINSKVAENVSAALTKSKLSDFFGFPISGHYKKFEFTLSLELSLTELIYHAQFSDTHETPWANFDFHKKANSYEVTTVYRRKEAWIQKEPNTLGPAMMTLAFFDKMVASLVALDPFVVTSERTGIALFSSVFDELNSFISKETYGLTLRKNRGSRPSAKHVQSSASSLYNLPSPIIDNIDAVRGRRLASKSSLLYIADLYNLLADLSGGEFLEKKNSIEFKPKDADDVLPIHAASSSTKSVYLIEKFIKQELKEGSVLIIDEPELNLHIDNQVKMAHLLTTLVNCGVKVVITTHSDHMLREINNLIMLASSEMPIEDKKTLMEEYKINESALIKAGDISAYVVLSESHEVVKAEVLEYGIDLELFNKEIIGNNNRLRAIRGSLLV